MIRKYLILLVLTFEVIFGYGQNLTSNNVTKQSRIDIGFEGIGLAFEPTILPFVNIDFTVGIGGYYDISESNFDYYLNPKKPALFVSINPKYFYNRNRRALKGRNTNLNSGSYFGVKAKYASESISSDVFSERVLLYNIHWGIQRQIGKNILLNAYAGLGYGHEADSKFGTPYPVLGMKLSYVLFEKD